MPRHPIVLLERYCRGEFPPPRGIVLLIVVVDEVVVVLNKKCGTSFRRAARIRLVVSILCGIIFRTKARDLHVRLRDSSSFCSIIEVAIAAEEDTVAAATTTAAGGARTTKPEEEDDDEDEEQEQKKDGEGTKSHPIVRLVGSIVWVMDLALLPHRPRGGLSSWWVLHTTRLGRLLLLESSAA